MNDLVTRLSERRQPVEVSIRPTRSVKALKECLDRGYVHITFNETRGGTELGIPVDRTRTDVRDADFEHETGRLRLVGDLSLDFVRVRCVADIELSSLTGSAQLEPLEDDVATSHDAAGASPA